MRSPTILLGPLCTYFLLVVSCSKPTIEANILVQNGRVYDRFQNQEPNHATAIKDDKIVFIGNESSVTIKAKKTIDTTGLIVFPACINKSTSITAEIFGIPKRGKPKEGYYADIILFNPKTFKDIADYKNAFAYSEGLEYSIINGKIAVEEGECTDVLYGKVNS